MTRARPPAAAGMFYPADPGALADEVRRCASHELGPGAGAARGAAAGAICPHAGLAYSGPLACRSLMALPAGAGLFVMIGPNHWGLGCDVATVRGYTWETPLGPVEVDSEAAAELRGECGLVEFDAFAHSKEHSLEVPVAMMRALYGGGFRILPVLMSAQDRGTAEELGHAVARVAASRGAAVVGSSDLTHYEPDGDAREKDAALIAPMLAVDTGAFYAELEGRGVTACGYGAVAATMTACADLGASGGELLGYATSGDAGGDRSSVVGYCSVAFR